MRPAPPTVVKVGGSLLSEAARLARILVGLAEGDAGPCVIVPGGGPFADAVRDVQDRAGLSDALAHRLALDAMGRMAEVFRAIEPRLAVTTDLDAAAFGRAMVWDPAALKAGRPDIPETWAVTSDSLALWLATHLGSPRCILIKSVDRPAATSLSDLARLGVVDDAFPDFAARYAGEIVIRGPGTTPLKVAA